MLSRITAATTTLVLVSKSDTGVVRTTLRVLGATGITIVPMEWGTVRRAMGVTKLMVITALVGIIAMRVTRITR